MSEAAPRPRVMVVGLGGIGGVVTAELAEQDVELVPITSNLEIAAAIEREGYRLSADGETRVVRGPVYAAPPPGASVDFVLLATQPPQAEAAVRDIAHALAPDGAVVCFQNGLMEARVAELVGPDRVIGAVVAWGVSMLGPGHYERTSGGGFTIGRLGAGPDARCERLAGLLECVGPTELAPDLAAARWSKLAINCAISTLGTIGGERLGALLKHRHVRRLALDIMTETVEVARREGVRPKKVAGTLDLEWMALTEDEKAATGSPGLVAKHAALLAVGARYRRLRSSMLSAIERGRPPAVDFLNGEVVSRGQRHGIATPVNARCLDEVHRIARGEVRSSLERLREVYDATRDARTRG
jgi:2-dehydropantoate 2-reductase